MMKTVPEMALHLPPAGPERQETVRGVRFNRIFELVSMTNMVIYVLGMVIQVVNGNYDKLNALKKSMT